MKELLRLLLHPDPKCRPKNWKVVKSMLSGTITHVSEKAIAMVVVSTPQYTSRDSPEGSTNIMQQMAGILKGIVDSHIYEGFDYADNKPTKFEEDDNLWNAIQEIEIFDDNDKKGKSYRYKFP